MERLHYNPTEIYNPYSLFFSSVHPGPLCITYGHSYQCFILAFFNAFFDVTISLLI